MSEEGQQREQKSIRYALEKHKDLDGLTCDCVAFANAAGGIICLGIEDGELEPPADQRIDVQLVESIRKRIPQQTVNVHVVPQVVIAPNGGQYLELRVSGNQQSIAATSVVVTFCV